MAHNTETPRRIQLKGNGHFEEAVAAGAITPGHLIKLNSVGKVVVHATAVGEAERAFALEDALQGNTIADAYASGDTVFYYLAQPGDVIYALLSAGESVVIGDQLVSNGDGCLKKTTATTDKILAVALQTVDASDSNVDGQDDERIKVRVL